MTLFHKAWTSFLSPRTIDSIARSLDLFFIPQIRGRSTGLKSSKHVYLLADRAWHCSLPSTRLSFEAIPWKKNRTAKNRSFRNVSVMPADAYLVQYIWFHHDRACSMDFEIKFRSVWIRRKGTRKKGRQLAEGMEEKGKERKNSALLISKVYRGRRKSVRTLGVLLCLIDRVSIIDLPSLCVPSILTLLPLLQILEESITIIQRESFFRSSKCQAR